MIAEHIYMATQSELHSGKTFVTMAELSEVIDNIINMNVVLWRL